MAQEPNVVEEQNHVHCVHFAYCLVHVLLVVVARVGNNRWVTLPSWLLVVFHHGVLQQAGCVF